jgi:hypothetical protein
MKTNRKERWRTTRLPGESGVQPDSSRWPATTQAWGDRDIASGFMKSMTRGPAIRSPQMNALASANEEPGLWRGRSAGNGGSRKLSTFAHDAAFCVCSRVRFCPAADGSAWGMEDAGGEVERDGNGLGNRGECEAILGKIRAGSP